MQKTKPSQTATDFSSSVFKFTNRFQAEECIIPIFCPQSPPKILYDAQCLQVKNNRLTTALLVRSTRVHRENKHIVSSKIFITVTVIMKECFHLQQIT